MDGKSSSVDTPKKRKGNGKGPNFERLLAKKLSLWASDGTRDDLIWRTSGSGARAKVRAHKGDKTAGAYGDLKAEHPKAFFLFKNTVFELKIGYKNWCVLSVIDQPKTKANQKKKTKQTFTSFCDQVEEDTINGDVENSVMITKKDRREAVIWIETHLFSKLFKKQIKEKTIQYVKIVAPPNKSYSGVSLEYFLDNITPVDYDKIMNGEVE